jgi:2-oxoisovalerate dehydrogenase E1 component alpha subunit
MRHVIYLFFFWCSGDGIISRAEGYGIHSIRVDGNDLLAVHEATQAARQYAVSNNRPVLIEAMTYRGGHHSTSDDSTRYRTPAEIAYWAESDNPVQRVRLLLEQRGLWSAEKETAMRDQVFIPIFCVVEYELD